MPAFGRPTSAASATSFSRSSSSASSPGSPVSAKRGVWRVGVAKWRLPRPPPPPRATTTRAPGATRSAMSCSVVVETCVPTGTRNSMSAPSAPCLPRPAPVARRVPALYPLPTRNRRGRGDRGRRRARRRPRARRRRRPGPPFGTNFSRRKLSAAVAAASGGDVDGGAVVEHGEVSLAECCSSTGRDGRARCKDAESVRSWRLRTRLRTPHGAAQRGQSIWRYSGRLTYLKERERNAVEEPRAVDEDLVRPAVHRHEVPGVTVGDLAGHPVRRARSGQGRSRAPRSPGDRDTRGTPIGATKSSRRAQSSA